MNQSQSSWTSWSNQAQLEQNKTLPVTISEVRVLHATNTRRGFLQGIVKPLLRQDAEEPFTLLEAREQIDKVGRKLDKLGAQSIQLDTP